MVVKRGGWPNYAGYSADRRRELVESNFSFWIFRHDPIGCDGRHEDLDGIVLSPHHPFWSRFFPPLDDACACYVVGAHVESGIARLGGDPNKAVPEWSMAMLDTINENPRRSRLWQRLRSADRGG